MAIALSAVAIYISVKTRKADAFARLYDELNTRSFGVAMESVGEWVAQCAVEVGRPRDEMTEADIRGHYRIYLEALPDNHKITKKDDLESARRTVKAWFIKCWLFHKVGDLTRPQLDHLVTDDRTELMWFSFFMTREQTDVWKRRPHDPTSRSSSDEKYFTGLADAGFLPRTSDR